MIVLDTSCLVRFFTGDDERKKDKVVKLLESSIMLVAPDVIFPELEYVLRKLYGIDRSEVLAAYRFLVNKANVRTTPKVVRAIEIYDESNLDMADCLVAASLGEKDKLASFDKKLLKVKGVKRYWRG